ncbi:MAG: PAS domain S-box protein [Proteobacteria bacterium]|nr:PAS domain S-box protein [Pseudomonadota bacterium]
MQNSLIQLLGLRVEAVFAAFLERKRSAVYDYLLAAVLMVFALFVRLTLAPVNAGVQYVTFFPAVMLAAIACGFRAGVFATVIGLLFATYFFIPPYYSFALESFTTGFWSNMVFFADGVIMSLSIEAMHRYRKNYQQELGEVRVSQTRLVLLNLELDKRIADLAKSELALQRFQAIIDSTEDAVISQTPDGLITSWNTAAERVFGYAAAEVIGKSVLAMIPPEHLNEEHEILSCILRGEKLHHFETVRLRKDGKLINISATISPILNDEGRVAGISRIARDITEKKNDEILLQQAKEAAERANRAKSDFLAAMSHEIRTPMNGVIGMLDVLTQTGLNGHQIEMVSLINDSAYSLLGIIDDILDFSKIEAGKLNIEQEPLSIEDVVDKSCNLFGHIAEKKRVELTLFVDPAIPQVVLGDALRLRQILTNLTNNAIKFSSRGHQTGQVMVRACVLRREDERVWLKFTVRDNGIGMDEPTQARLFMPFEQADFSTSRRFGGTGLGLAIARQLANLMDGEISVKSKPDEGSIFTVQLPFAVGPQIAMTGSQVAGLACLVIGSDTGLSDDIALQLEHAGASVQRVADIEAARQVEIPVDALWVWVLDTMREKPPLTALRAAVGDHAGVQLLLISRGNRRRARRVSRDLVKIDGNLLSRLELLRAVAISAGRAEPEQLHESTGLSSASFDTPSREEAVKLNRLILLAEDNATNQQVIRQQLALLGFASEIANDGLEALRLWKTGDYALLLTDLHMPHRDGYELTADIRAVEASSGLRRTPVIALTANALKDEAEHCKTTGMDDYLPKPLRLEILRTMLKKWLPATLPAPSDAPVDVRVLEALVGRNPVVIRDLLGDFRLSAAAIAAGMNEDFSAGRLAGLGAGAHKLKSSARTIGALRLGLLCEQLEHAVKENAVPAELVAQFNGEMRAADNYLANWLKVSEGLNAQAD